MRKESKLIGHAMEPLAFEKSITPKDTTLHKDWMIQLSSECKSTWEKDFLPPLKLSACSTLGRDFLSISFDKPVIGHQLQATVFPRWACPIEHRWPTNPHSEKFVEKACLGLIKKFGTNWNHLQVLSSIPELKRIAVGIKGRLNQLQNNSLSSAHYEEDKLVAVLIHPKGILAGSRSHQIDLGSAYSGGLGFLKNAPQTHLKSDAHEPDDFQLTSMEAPTSSKPTSRAGGKIAEILALFDSVSIRSSDYHHWLELGAAPGGMTAELLAWGARVTAVDLAELAPQLRNHPHLTYMKCNAEQIASAKEFHVLLSDMNGQAANSSRIVASLIPSLQKGSLIIFTLKVPSLDQLQPTLESVKDLFQSKGAKLIFNRHLFHNRKEITILAIKS